LSVVLAEARVPVTLWPDAVPGQDEAKAPPVFSENTDGGVLRITKVTDPALIVYEANPERRNGAAIIVCPGGGYNLLAADKEGYEVAEWLSQIGYSAFVLHYRVPQQQMGALQDVQRAIRLLRGESEVQSFDADKIGVLGFSAGGSLAALASTRHKDPLYERTGASDSLSARPDFAVLIYPAYLDLGPGNTLTPEIHVDEQTPPMFLFVSADDFHANSSLVMAAALRQKQVPFELHVLPTGGHGYGMRPGNRAAEKWPHLLQSWLEATVLQDE